MKDIDLSPEAILPWPVTRQERIPKRTFKKIVIINDPDQFNEFLNDDQALALCFDFYTWAYLFHKKKNALFYEDLIWDDMHIDQVNDVYRCAQSWYLRDGKDISLYKGVSLGAMYNKEGIGVCAVSLRFLTCIKKVVSTFSPELVILHDNDESGSFFSREFAEIMLTDYLPSVKVALTVVPKEKRLKPKMTKYPALNHRLNGRMIVKKPTLKVRLRNFIVDTINRLLPLPYYLIRSFDKRPRVWINVMSIFMEPVLSQAPKGYAPLVLSKQTPKSPRLILKLMMKGVLWADLKEKPLTTSDNDELVSAYNRIQKVLETPFKTFNDDWDYVQKLLFMYVKNRVLDLETLKVTAGFQNASDAFVKDWNVETLIVQSTISPEYRTRIEATFKHNKKVIHTFHGWKTYNYPWEDFSPYPKMQHASWGESNTKWLINHSAPKESIGEVGCPAFEFCLPIKYYDHKTLNDLKHKKILLLGYHNGGPFNTVQNIFEEYEVIFYFNKLLKMLGNTEVRLRLHPHHNYEYHRKISEMFGQTLNCDGEKGKLPEHLDWSDIVVGPVMTTAYIEAFARGKPCFGLCIGTGESFEYFEGLDISRSVAEVVQKIINKKWPDQRVNLEKTAMLHTDDSVIDRLWKFIAKVTDQ